MLIFQVTVTLLTLIISPIFVLLHKNAAIVNYHLLFSIGIIPLILAAMVHFIPVLARSKKPGKWIHFLPVLALGSGLLITSHFAFPQRVIAGQYLGASIDLFVTANLGVWAYHLKSKSIGTPHPCLDWYLVALLCLFIALTAIVLTYFIPSQHLAFRLLHLHLNTLGFIGFTALGTLQVLLPTATKRPDPKVASRMQQYIKWMVAGALITACSAAWNPKLAWIGFTLLVIPILGILKCSLQLYWIDIFKLNGTAPALVAALCGYIFALIIGITHAYHQADLNPISTFIIAFLMPLVTGAVSYLLPLWLRPGQQTAWHQTTRSNLARNNGLRALTFLMGGVMAGTGHEVGWTLAALTVGTFIAQTLFLFIHRTEALA